MGGFNTRQSVAFGLAFALSASVAFFGVRYAEAQAAEQEAAEEASPSAPHRLREGAMRLPVPNIDDLRRVDFKDVFGDLDAAMTVNTPDGLVFSDGRFECISDLSNTAAEPVLCYDMQRGESLLMNFTAQNKVVVLGQALTSALDDKEVLSSALQDRNDEYAKLERFTQWLAQKKRLFNECGIIPFVRQDNLLPAADNAPEARRHQEPFPAPDLTGLSC